MGRRKKPYRFSKKAGRYISNSQKGNRLYYFEYLSDIVKNIEVDPNTTFGKLFLKKITPKLKLHRKLKNEFLGSKNEIFFFKKKLNQAIEDEKKNKDSLLSGLRYQKQKEKALNNKFYKTQNSTYFRLFYFFFFFINTIILSATKHYVYVFLNVFLGIFFWQVIERKSQKIFDSHKNFEQESIDNEVIKKHVQNITSDSNSNSKLLLMKKRKKELNNVVLNCEIEIKQFTKEFLDDNFIKFVLSEDFYASIEWRNLRQKVLKNDPNLCSLCGKNYDLEVDHIRPRSKFPNLALRIDNLQILCKSCNTSKGVKA